MRFAKHLVSLPAVVTALAIVAGVVGSCLPRLSRLRRRSQSQMRYSLLGRCPKMVCGQP